MPTHIPLHTTDGAARQAASASRRVIDAPTRMFHWLFALSFLGAYLTADGEQFRLLHVTLGYTMAGLLVFRVLYGLFGPRQAGLGMLWRKLAHGPAWLRSLGTAPSLSAINWRQGQNLLMTLAIIALLVTVVPLTLSGYATYNDWAATLGGDWLEDVHAFFGEAMLFVVLTHLVLITGISILRRKNQATPMLTGKVEGTGPSLVEKNRAWLAVALLVAAMGFCFWQWQQSPDGLLATSSAIKHTVDKGRVRHTDDD